jgi:hypothetical protein
LVHSSKEQLHLILEFWLQYFFFSPSLSSFGGHINGLHLLHETRALGLGPSPSHYGTPTPRILLFIVPQGPDFHGALPLLVGTYEIGLALGRSVKWTYLRLSSRSLTRRRNRGNI